MKKVNSVSSYIARFREVKNKKDYLKLYSLDGPYNPPENISRDLTNMITKELFYLNLENKKDNEIYILSSNEDTETFYIYKISKKTKKDLDETLNKLNNQLFSEKELNEEFNEMELIMGYKIVSLTKSKISRDNYYYAHLIAYQGGRDSLKPLETKCFNEYKSYNDAINEFMFYAVERSKKIKPKKRSDSIIVDTSTSYYGEIRIYKNSKEDKNLLETIVMVPLNSFTDKETIFHTAFNKIKF